MRLVPDVPTRLTGIGEPDTETGKGRMLEPLFPMIAGWLGFLARPDPPHQIINLGSRLHGQPLSFFGHLLAPEGLHSDAPPCQRRKGNGSVMPIIQGAAR